MHYAIHKLHWPPYMIYDWLNAEQSVKAFYFASLEIKAEHDKKEAENMKKGKGKGGRKR